MDETVHSVYFHFVGARLSREEILTRARRAWAEDGIRSIEALAAAAGVSVSTFYRAFGGRAGLLEALGLEDEPPPRDKLLNAAAELLLTAGLAGLSMEDLAAAAGTSRATAYRLFPTKFDLMLQLLGHCTPADGVLAAVADDPQIPPERAVAELVRAVTGLDSAYPEILHRLLAQSPADSELSAAVGGYLQTAMTTVTKYFAIQHEAGHLREVDPILAAHLLIGPLLHHLLLRPVLIEHLGFQMSVDEVVAVLSGLWLDAMTPSATRRRAGTGQTDRTGKRKQ